MPYGMLPSPYGPHMCAPAEGWWPMAGGGWCHMDGWESPLDLDRPPDPDPCIGADVGDRPPLASTSPSAEAAGCACCCCCDAAWACCFPPVVTAVGPPPGAPLPGRAGSRASEPDMLRGRFGYGGGSE